jgi:hypothetical protein
MSKMTELASGAITAVDTCTIELVEADETRRSRLCQPCLVPAGRI